MNFQKKEVVMRKNIVAIASITSILFIIFVCIASAQGPRKQIREIEKMTTGQQAGPQKSKSASTLPMKGIGCWVQKTSLDNPHIYADVFGWYVVDAAIIDSFDNKAKKPLFMSYSGQSAAFLIKKMQEEKGKITGVIWDYEHDNTPQNVAEEDLKKTYRAAKDLNLSFGVAVLANPKASLRKNGVSYENAESFADFLMPMMYVQWFGMKRQKLENFLGDGRRATKLPIIVLLTIETTKTKPPKKLAPNEIVSIYKGLPADGFAVWNVKDLDKEYVSALSAL
jgi:hypothetical protein